MKYPGFLLSTTKRDLASAFTSLSTFCSVLKTAYASGLLSGAILSEGCEDLESPNALEELRIKLYLTPLTRSDTTCCDATEESVTFTLPHTDLRVRMLTGAWNDFGTEK